MFEDNSAGNSGGGFYGTGQMMRVYNSQWNNNLAENQGGAIYTTSREVSLVNSRFSANKAHTGAGISSTTSSRLEFWHSQCANHQGIIGGCLFADSVGVATFYNLTAEYNLAELGAVIGVKESYLFESAVTNISNSVFNYNRVCYKANVDHYLSYVAGFLRRRCVLV